MQDEIRTALFESVISTTKLALSSAILINGGATVSLLTFLGSLTARTGRVAAPLLVSLFLFAIGVLAAAMGTGTTYMAQHAYFHHGDESVAGRRWRMAGIWLVVFSYALFLAGIVGALCGLGAAP